MEQLIYFGVFCLLVLALCIVRPNAGRIFLGIFFLIMATAVNVVLVLVAPEQFVALGTQGAIVPSYKWSFEHIVIVAPALFGLLTAAYEIAVGLLLLSHGKYVKWGLIGGIAFLIGITPLGIYTLANPIMALAMAYLLTKNFEKSLAEIVRSATRPRPRSARATTSATITDRTSSEGADPHGWN
ncbi:hypothetical protein [Mycetocola miduiensis]|uniref:Uncharacterized protein n=1 Tax=Mycetocola miduiensis TaxID=995034 RepID=A0A1I5CVA5_9MICO|nr:hypothetical protein [Mycetocola miduiensis]SFN90863.1 hypothetical protein SAMN05216219_2598 [Mycetocola miduiensis]